MWLEASVRRHFISALVLVALCFAVYAHSLLNRFSYDDYLAIVDNPVVKQLRNLRQVFAIRSGAYFLGFNENSWRPVVTISYFADYALWQLRPFGYHLQNVCLHTSVVVLLYVFLFLVVRSRVAAIAGAGLFAAHPALSEAVNAVGFREDLLAGLLLLAAFLFYLRRDGQPARKRAAYLVFSLGMFSLALLSKEMAIALPALLFLHELSSARHGRAGGRWWLRGYLAHAGLAVAYLVLYALFFREPTGSPEPYLGNSVFITILTMPRVFVRYVRLLLLPGRFSVDYYLPLAQIPPQWWVYLSIAVLVGYLLATAFAFWRRSRAFLPLAWFAVALLPVADIIPIPNPIAERYLYVPFIGMALLPSLFVVRLSGCGGRGRAAGCFLLAVVLGCFSVMTVKQNRVWRDAVRLWTNAVERFPESARAHSYLGASLARGGRPEEAIAENLKALALNPEERLRAIVHFNLGRSYKEVRRFEEAVRHYEEALALSPASPWFWTGLGVARYQLDQVDGAMEAFRRAITFNPNDYAALSNLGTYYASHGKMKEGKELLLRAVAVNPAEAWARANLGMVYIREGRKKEGLLEMERAARSDPADVRIRVYLGWALEANGRGMEAETQYLDAARMAPTYAPARLALGRFYLAAGAPKRALGYLLEAIELDPKDASAFWELAQAYEALGNNERAIAAYSKLLGGETVSPEISQRAQERVTALRAGRTQLP